jgi:hypothetical protein
MKTSSFTGRQIVCYTSSQSPVHVGMRHEVHYYVIWVYTEVSNVLRVVVTDFFFNCWCLEIRSDKRIRHVLRCVCNNVQKFGLEAF